MKQVGVFHVNCTLSVFIIAGVVFPLTGLLEATGQKKEDNLLGRGGYGEVYKGVWCHTTVAVKFLNEVWQAIDCLALHNAICFQEGVTSL